MWCEELDFGLGGQEMGQTDGVELSKDPVGAL